MENKYEIILYNDEDVSVKVNLDKENNTVWLFQKQILEHFNVFTKNIELNIINILYSKELDTTTTDNYSSIEQEGKCNIRIKIKYYNLDMII